MNSPASFSAPTLRNALRLAARALGRTPKRKSTLPVTRDVLDKLLGSGERLVDLRDRTLLLVAFASGGRHRSEAARFAVEDLVERPPVAAYPTKPDGPKIPALALRLDRTKTTSGERDELVLIIGRPVDELRRWILAADIKTRPIFRAVDRWGVIGPKATDAKASAPS